MRKSDSILDTLSVPRTLRHKMKTDIALCLWVSSHNMFDVAGNVTILTAIIEHGEAGYVNPEFALK